MYVFYEYECFVLKMLLFLQKSYRYKKMLFIAEIVLHDQQ